MLIGTGTSVTEAAPAKNIADSRRVHRTIKGGRVFDPAELEKAMGMSEK